MQLQIRARRTDQGAARLEIPLSPCQCSSLNSSQSQYRIQLLRRSLPSMDQPPFSSTRAHRRPRQYLQALSFLPYPPRLMDSCTTHLSLDTTTFYKQIDGRLSTEVVRSL